MSVITNTQTSTQLTAPGNGSYLSMTRGRRSKAMKIVVATIDTNLVVRIEYATRGSDTVTGRSFDMTITANGTYYLPIVHADARVRGVFVSESGGTAATVDFTLTEFVD